ncbi:hypothetical protein, partial [Salmonella enterica]|uniref:hypothetical protein n=1 Tax=Salmonella enterica TaxID=28901 RepID=UPI00398C6F29
IVYANENMIIRIFPGLLTLFYGPHLALLNVPNHFLDVLVSAMPSSPFSPFRYRFDAVASVPVGGLLSPTACARVA